MVHAVKQKNRADRRKAQSGRERISAVNRQSSKTVSDMDFEGMRIHYDSRTPRRERAAAFTRGRPVSMATEPIGQGAIQKSPEAEGEEGGTAIVKNDELIVRESKYLKDGEDIDWDRWAPNGGSVPGTIQKEQTLEAGTIIDRYGSPYGKYTSPRGTSYEQRALPYVENPNAYHVYRVLKSIKEVIKSTIAPAFEQAGGGIQYQLPFTIQQLINNNYLEEISDEKK